MNDQKSKYLKTLRVKVKELTKWKEEAIALLKSQNHENPDQHSSIIAYQEKINKLENEMKSFDSESNDFVKFKENQMVKKPPPPLNPVIANENKNSYDRWADVKMENQMNREWNWLCRMDSYLPDYIRTNLKNMPNNKGYVWKGIFYFGDLPKQHPVEITTLFEKQKEMLRIHEFSPMVYRIYEKPDKNKLKELVFEKFRK